MSPPDQVESVASLSDLSPQLLFADLPVSKLIFHLRSEKSLPPYFYFGSAWRGVLGWEMMKLICPFTKHQCATCCIQSNCPYFGLFEHQTALPGVQDAPRGYVLYPSREEENGDVQLNITLVGHCAAYVPVVIESVSRAAKRGVGLERIRFSLRDMRTDAPAGYDQGGTGNFSPQGGLPLSEWLGKEQDFAGPVRIFLPTPLRLRRQGRYLDRLEWPFFFQSLTRRLEGLHCVFGQGEPVGSAIWKELAHHFSRLSPPTVVQSRAAGSDARTGWLQWKDLKRFSNRQKKKVPMGGLVGEIVIQDLHPWLHTWLRAAELLHVGKGAAMGLGRVEVLGVAHG
jgi:hypothetical protein